MAFFQVWERLAERFPIFGQECDFRKFLTVVAKYHHEWRPFSGCGRKMVRVVVTEKRVGKGLQSSRAHMPLGCARPASSFPSTCSQPCLYPEGVAVSAAHSLHGESTPPTRGQSPQTKDEKGAQKVHIAGLLAVSRDVDRASAHCATTFPAPDIAARRTSGTFSVLNLLSPSPTAETQASASVWQHPGWQAATAPKQVSQKTMPHVHAPLLQKRPVRSWDSERPAKTKKKAGPCRDPLHLLLDALTQ